MDVDFERGRLYVSTFDGNLYRYKFSTPLDEVADSLQVFNILGKQH
jgi:lipoprotein NlpI